MLPVDEGQAHVGAGAGAGGGRWGGGQWEEGVRGIGEEKPRASCSALTGLGLLPLLLTTLS